MKKNTSKKLDKLFNIAKVKNIEDLIEEAFYSDEILHEVLRLYRRQFSLCGLIFMLVKIKQAPLFFSADQKMWISEGFLELSDLEKELIEGLLEKSNCPIAISDDGILCSLPIEFLHPLAQSTSAVA